MLSWGLLGTLLLALCKQDVNSSVVLFSEDEPDQGRMEYALDPSPMMEDDYTDLENEMMDPQDEEDGNLILFPSEGRGTEKRFEKKVSSGLVGLTRPRFGKRGDDLAKRQVTDIIGMVRPRFGKRKKRSVDSFSQDSTQESRNNEEKRCTLMLLPRMGKRSLTMAYLNSIILGNAEHNREGASLRKICLEDIKAFAEEQMRRERLTKSRQGKRDTDKDPGVERERMDSDVSYFPITPAFMRRANYKLYLDKEKIKNYFDMMLQSTGFGKRSLDLKDMVRPRFGKRGLDFEDMVRPRFGKRGMEIEDIVRPRFGKKSLDIGQIARPRFGKRSYDDGSYLKYLLSAYTPEYFMPEVKRFLVSGGQQ